MHFLHLEDDLPLQEILKIALSCSHATIKLSQFLNSDHAVDFLVRHLNEIDLFILDIRVPGKRNGLEVAQYIRDLGSTTPIVITSAYRQPTQEILKSLDCEWMAKPWHVLQAVDTLVPLASRNKEIAGV